MKRSRELSRFELETMCHNDPSSFINVLLRQFAPTDSFVRDIIKLQKTRNKVVSCLWHPIVQFLNIKEFVNVRITSRKNRGLRLIDYLPELNDVVTFDRLMDLRNGVVVSHIVINGYTYIPSYINSLHVKNDLRWLRDWKRKRGYNYQNVTRLILETSDVDKRLLCRSDGGDFAPNVKELEIRDEFPWHDLQSLQKTRFNNLQHLIWKSHDFTMLGEVLNHFQVPNFTWYVCFKRSVLPSFPLPRKFSGRPTGSYFKQPKDQNMELGSPFLKSVRLISCENPGKTLTKGLIAYDEGTATLIDIPWFVNVLK